MAKHNFKPSYFVPHLLETLRSESGNTTNPVKVTEEFLCLVCTAAGTTLDAMGTDQSSGQSLVKRQILYAERDLRKKGYTQKAKRSHYALTDKALTDAQAGTPKATPTPKVEVKETVEVKTEEETVVEVPTPEVSTPEVEITSTENPLKGLLYSAPISGFPSAGVYENARLRDLAIAQTKCFGHWSGSGRAVCKSCPLAKFCFTKQNLDLEAYALHKIANPTTAKEAGEEASPEETEAPATEAPSTSDAFDFQGQKAKSFDARIDGLCEHCKGAIKIGEKMVWARGTGTFHVKCATNYTP